MNRIIFISALAATCLLTLAPAWAHHAAEGIVTDEIWLMVDENLDGTGHDIVFEDIWASMDVDDSGSGQIALTTELEVWDAAVDLYLDAIYMAIDEISRIPSGTRSSGTPAVEVEDLEGDTSVITLWEPIGDGNSQVEPPMPGSGN